VVRIARSCLSAVRGQARRAWAAKVPCRAPTPVCSRECPRHRRAQRRKRGAQLAVIAVRPPSARRHAAALPRRPAPLIERDLMLSLKPMSSGTPALRDARCHWSLLRQIQPIGHRQAGMMIGNRQRHRNPGNCLSCKPAAYARNPDRMPSFLGKLVSSMIHASIGRVARSEAAPSPHLGQTCSSDQRPSAHKMQQRLMLGRHPRRRRHRRHRLHAFAFARIISPVHSPTAAAHDPHGRSRSQVPRHKPKTAIHCSQTLGDPWQPPC